jgi:predicted ATPase
LTFLYVSYIILTVLNKIKMTVTTNERGQQNLFAKEPQMYVSQTDAERYALESHAERAEVANSRWAMLGFVAAIVSYALTGHLFFGVI